MTAIFLTSLSGAMISPGTRTLTIHLVSLGKVTAARTFIENYATKLGVNLNVVNVEQAGKILNLEQSEHTIFWSLLSTAHQEELNSVSESDEEIQAYKDFAVKLDQLQQTEISKNTLQEALDQKEVNLSNIKVASTLSNWFGMSQDGEEFRFKTNSLDIQVVKQIAVWEKLISNLKADPSSEEKTENTEKHQPPQAPRKNVLSVIVFYGLSCIGKTHFSEFFNKICTERGIQFYSVSSDESSRQAMDAYLKANPQHDEETAFTKSKKQGITIFNNNIKKVIKELESGPALLFLDKVMHGGRFLKGFKKSFPSSTHEIRMIAVYPWTDSRFIVNKGFNVPFSASLILNVCHRMLNRDAHETVSGSIKKKLFLALSFVMLYKNIRSIEKLKSKDCDYHSFHTLNFGVGVPPFTTSNHKSDEIPVRWLHILRQTLSGIVPFREGEENCQEMAEMLVNDCEDLKPFIGYVPDTEIYSEVSGLVEYIFL